jgi:hypothetical protein
VWIFGFEDNFGYRLCLVGVRLQRAAFDGGVVVSAHDVNFVYNEKEVSNGRVLWQTLQKLPR